MGRQHISNGELAVTQQKTGAKLAILVLPELAECIEQTPGGNLNFLVTEYGSPFTTAGFGAWFRKRCDEADLPKECTFHGLRKAACTRLAEAGCSANVIAAISGHTSLKEVERYTRAADQKRLAAIGMRLMRTNSDEESVNENARVDKLRKKS
jgi:integrase